MAPMNDQQFAKQFLSATSAKDRAVHCAALNVQNVAVLVRMLAGVAGCFAPVHVLPIVRF